MNTATRLMLTALCALPMACWAGEAHTANEKVVLDFIAAMDRATASAAVGELPGIVEKFWTENCVQHRSGVRPGRDGVLAALRELPAFAKTPGAPAAGAPFKTITIAAAQDRVILVRRSVQPDPTDPSKSTERYVFNTYRLEGGKIAENWWAMSM